MTIHELKKYARKGITAYIDEWRDLVEKGIVKEEDAEQEIEKLQKDYLTIFRVLQFD